ncbi:MAG: hypothetical protein WC492_01060 [Candidatus Micrarchaeia archaeon]
MIFQAYREKVEQNANKKNESGAAIPIEVKMDRDAQWRWLFDRCRGATVRADSYKIEKNKDGDTVITLFDGAEKTYEMKISKKNAEGISIEPIIFSKNNKNVVFEVKGAKEGTEFYVTEKEKVVGSNVLYLMPFGKEDYLKMVWDNKEKYVETVKDTLDNVIKDARQKKS